MEIASNSGKPLNIMKPLCRLCPDSTSESMSPNWNGKWQDGQTEDEEDDPEKSGLMKFC